MTLGASVRRSQGVYVMGHTTFRDRKRVEAVIKPTQFDDLRDALVEVGVRGITVTEVKGVGRTSGREEVSRGGA